uniref:EGF-like domain-containing protein n=1 Tax=Branchiostoma floridae TaxID=7739 RepID=C3Z167_BRAFL|eukprot:XP_002597754.1 hypothetical protein BRAFLDRAFT_77344 [Branchiostoma floridae]
MNSSTPWRTFYQENSSTVAYSILPSTQSGLELTMTATDPHINIAPKPTTLTPLTSLTTDINECTTRKPCQHGRCVNKAGGYICICSPGWTGQDCHQDINECTTRKPCQHGRCVNKDSGYKCTCSNGWSGQNCQQDINECTKHPCQHGRCVNKDGGYKCTCSPGWTGLDCHRDINECTRNPCQHGRCVNKAGGYICFCSPGWTGQNCQQVSECHWEGTAPFCKTDSCSRGSYVRRSDCGDGQCCWTGSKIYCCLG